LGFLWGIWGGKQSKLHLFRNKFLTKYLKLECKPVFSTTMERNREDCRHQWTISFLQQRERVNLLICNNGKRRLTWNEDTKQSRRGKLTVGES
jgi:hypothetical protein